MSFYAKTLTPASTKLQTEDFVDQLSGDKFSPKHVMIVSKADNADDLTFYFLKDTVGVTLTAGQVMTMDDLDLNFSSIKCITRYHIKFVNSGDSAQVVAW